MITKTLKNATKEQHQELEKIVNVLDESASLDSYKNLLLKFYRIYSALEPKLPVDELIEQRFDYRRRQKLPLLIADLGSLGILEFADRLIPYPEIPDMKNAARAFGAAYVIEGSTLGGQMISRHLREHLGITPDSGSAFFSSYGREVGAMWKEFCDAANAFAVRHPVTGDMIIAAAKETFAAFAKCFSEPLKMNGTN